MYTLFWALGVGFTLIGLVGLFTGSERTLDALILGAIFTLEAEVFFKDD